jgi:hypothetical protein
MRVHLKVALIAAIGLSLFAFPGASRCDDVKTDCGRLKRILDQYTYNLSYKHMYNAHYAAETREKELPDQIKGLKLDKDLTANIDSLLGHMKQCQPNRVVSAAYGVKGFFSDLNFLMKTDADLRKRCEGLEPLYKHIFKECEN